MSPGSTHKQQLRSQLLGRRQQLTRRAVAHRSRTICHHVERLPAFHTAGTILFYYPVRREVSPLPLLRRANARGTVCLLPIVTGHGTLAAGRVTGYGDLTLGPYGIPAPRHPAPAWFHELDLIVVPGLAFSPSGQRLGYGGGYYDRLLQRLQERDEATGASARLHTLGLCYRWALHRRLPHQAHDQTVDLVVTEDGVHHAAAEL